MERPKFKGALESLAAPWVASRPPTQHCGSESLPWRTRRTQRSAFHASLGHSAGHPGEPANRVFLTWRDVSRWRIALAESRGDAEESWSHPPCQNRQRCAEREVAALQSVFCKEQAADIACWVAAHPDFVPDGFLQRASARRRTRAWEATLSGRLDSSMGASAALMHGRKQSNNRGSLGQPLAAVSSAWVWEARISDGGNGVFVVLSREPKDGARAPHASQRRPTSHMLLWPRLARRAPC